MRPKSSTHIHLPDTTRTRCYCAPGNKADEIGIALEAGRRFSSSPARPYLGLHAAHQALHAAHKKLDQNEIATDFLEIAQKALDEVRPLPGMLPNIESARTPLFYLRERAEKKPRR